MQYLQVFSNDDLIENFQVFFAPWLDIFNNSEKKEKMM